MAIDVGTISISGGGSGFDRLSGRIAVGNDSVPRPPVRPFDRSRLSLLAERRSAGATRRTESLDRGDESVDWDVRSTGREAAVDDQSVTGDERGLVAGEEEDRVGDLLRLSESLERVVLGHRLAGRLRIALLLQVLV